MNNDIQSRLSAIERRQDEHERRLVALETNHSNRLISSLSLVGMSRFNSDYKDCRIGGFSGESVCYGGMGTAYVLGFIGKNPDGKWVRQRSAARISRPTLISESPASVGEIPRWGYIESTFRLCPKGVLDRGDPSHPCITDTGWLAWSSAVDYEVTPDQSQDDCGFGSGNLKEHAPTSRKLTGRGVKHNRVSGWCLPLNKEIRKLHPLLGSADWLQGGCITSGAATSSFGPALFAVAGNAAHPMMYFPYNPTDSFTHLPLQRGNDLPNQPGSGTGRIQAHQGPTKACIVGTNLVVITACALGPSKRIGNDSVDAELFEWRLLVFDLRDMVPVLNGEAEPWSVRHYIELPVYVEPAGGWTRTALTLPHIPGVRDEDYTKIHKPWGLMYDHDAGELILIRTGADESVPYEPPPVLYHLRMN